MDETYGTLSVPVDLDGDGQMELVTGNAAYNPDGSVKWSNRGMDGLVAVADFDLDGQGEIVKTSGSTVTYMETDGTEVWSKNYADPGVYLSIGAAAIDDMDDDGEPELAFAAANELVVLDKDGKKKWSARVTDSSGAAGPVLFDFELDGYPEVLYGDEVAIQFFSGLDGGVKYRSDEHDSYTIL